jgi:hypothetical protein
VVCGVWCIVIVNGDVIFEYCPTAEQLADTFTKPLDEETFLKFRKRMLVDVPVIVSPCYP